MDLRLLPWTTTLKSLAGSKRRALGAAVGAALTIGATVQLTWIAGSHWALVKAEGQLIKGYGALAAETMHPFREYIANDRRGCRAILAAYYQGRQADRLYWASQTCAASGVDIADVAIATAMVEELSGHDTQALEILNSAISRFEGTADIYYRMAQILRRIQRDPEALLALFRAAELDPSNNALSMETLQYFSSQNRWNEAKVMAKRLLSAQSDSPKTKLLIGRVFLRTGDRSTAQIMIDQARALLIKQSPEIQSMIEREYADLLNKDALSTVSPQDSGRGPASNHLRLGPSPASLPRTF